MKITEHTFRKKACKALAVLSAAAMFFSCGTSTAYVSADTLPIEVSAANAASQILVHDDSLNTNLAANPVINLDNSDIANGRTSITLTISLADASGNTSVSDDELFYEVSTPNNSLNVEDLTASGSKTSRTLKLSAYNENNGTKTPLTAGNVTITFSNKKNTAASTIRVTVFNPATDMKIFWDGSSEPLPLNDLCPTNATTVTAVKGHSYHLTTELIPADSNDTVVWAVYDGNYEGVGQSSSTDKAVISPTGVFTANKEGTVTIVSKFNATSSSPRQYSFGNKLIYANGTSGDTMNAYVKTVPKYIHVNIVNANTAQSIEFTDAPTALEVGDAYQIKSRITPSDATDNFKWVSSDASVITVTSGGLIKALKQGSATITLYAEDQNIYAEQKIRVIKKATALTITSAAEGSSFSTRVGVPIELAAKMDPDDADEEIVWSVSNSNIATIVPSDTGEFGNTQKAVLTGIAEGKVTVKATALVSGVSSQCEVTVDPRKASDGLTLYYEVNGVKPQIIEGSTLNIFNNQDLTIKAALTAEDGTTPDDAVKWTIMNNDNATVTISGETDDSITIHGSSEGTVLVKAYAENDESICRNFGIQVLRACDKIRFVDTEGNAYPTPKSLNIGDLSTIKADLTIEGNYPYQHSDRIVSWTSSDPETAQIDSEGNIRAIKNGNVSITARTASGREASISVVAFTTSQVIMTNVNVSDDGSIPTKDIEVNKQMEGSWTFGVTIKDDHGNNMGNTSPLWTSSNENVGVISSKGQFTATGLGKTIITVRSGSKIDQCEVTVYAKIVNAEFSTIEPQLYSPIKQFYEPKPTVTFAGKTLIEGVDYELSYTNNTEIGSAALTAVGKGNYTAERTIGFNISTRSLNDEEIEVNYAQQVDYTGEAQTPKVEVTCMKILLTEGTDYKISYQNNVNPGNATIILQGQGNYKDRRDCVFEVYCDHSDSTEPVLKREATCTETGIMSKVCNKCHQTVETEIPMIDHNYEEKVVPPTANDQGFTLHTCTMCGDSYKDNFVDKIPGVSILECTATITGSSFGYTGSPITPIVTLRYDGETLTENADYTVTYINNVEVGTGYAIITGLGNYTGTGKVSFQITESGGNIDTDNTTELIMTDEDSDTDDGRISLNQGKVLYLDDVVFNPNHIPYEPKPVVNIGDDALIENVDYVLQYANNSKVGTATVIMRGIGRFKSFAQFQFDILPRPLTDAEITVTAIDKQICTGSPLTPSVIIDCGGEFLQNRKDFKLEYSNNTKPGVANIKITGIGNYTDSVNLSFIIECNHVYSDQVIAPTHSARGYTLHTCKICGATFTDSYVDQLGTTSLDDCVVDIPTAVAYTGEARTPKVTITNGSETLREGLDYTVEYSNNTEIGLANITVRGIGAYTGIITSTFQITKGMMGDVNGDHEISSDDALLILRYTVGLMKFDNTQIALADVTGDSVAATDDSLAILRYTVGYRDKGVKIG